jgi:hypothetical protein
MRCTPTWLVLLLLGAHAAAQSATPTKPVAGPTVLTHVFTMGASLSDGFVNGLPVARLLKLGVRDDAMRVDRQTSSAFFLMPLQTGKQQVDRALRVKATLVVAADFLFWYAYGRQGQIAQMAKGQVAAAGEPAERERALRLWLLQQGLAELDRIEAPIVIGDVPDMTGADPKMLHPSQIPSAAARDAVNEAIRAWAKERPRVLLLPMAKWVEDMRAGRMSLPPRERGQAPLSLSADRVLCGDRLHPSKVGAVVFGQRLCEALADWLPAKERKSVAFDVWAIVGELGLESELLAPAGGK